MKKEIIFAITIIFVLFLFGCVSNTNQGTPNETKLEVTEGIGVLKDSIKISDLFPGGEGFISYTIRDNLGGVTARDIIFGLDNLGKFKIFECGGLHNGTDKRSSVKNCKGSFDLDSQLMFSERGTKKMIPGQELTTYWRIKAPNANEIGYISLDHPLYYFVEYTYWTAHAQSVAFMSQNELIRRQQTGENTEVTGKSKISAGEMLVNFETPQPIIYFYSFPNNYSKKEPAYDFTAVYSVKNVGGGYPLSDVMIVVELPSGINATSQTFSNYNWKNITESDCKLTNGIRNESNKEMTNCKQILDYVMPNSGINYSRTIVYILNRNDLVREGNKIPCGLQIEAKTMQEMKSGSVPMKFFNFQTFVIYRYYKEGSTTIHVYPLRV